MNFSLSAALRLLLTLYMASPIVGIPLWISWLALDGELPSLIATHWGFNGRADGFMEPGAFATSMALVFGILWALTVWMLWSKRLPNYTRWVVVAPIVLIYLAMLNLVIESVLIQRGLTDVTEVRLPLLPLVVLFASIPLILVFTLSKPKVEVRDGHLSASVWAVPILKEPVEQISTAEVVQLRARDYGGLGYRFGRHGFAIIPRPGEGLLLTLSDGKKVAIRCDHASDLAKHLETKGK